MDFDAENAVRIARWFIATRPKLKRLGVWVQQVWCVSRW